jgi:hypothetical protein
LLNIRSLPSPPHLRYSTGQAFARHPSFQSDLAFRPTDAFYAIPLCSDSHPHGPAPLRPIPPHDGHHPTPCRQASSRAPTQGWLAPRLWPLQSTQVQNFAHWRSCLHDYQAAVVLVFLRRPRPRNPAALGRFAPRVPSAEFRLPSMSSSQDGLRQAAAFLLEVSH